MKIKFVSCDGKWISSENTPKNSLSQYYVVTLTQIESHFNILPEQYFRYYDNCWQCYHDGEWSKTWNPLFKLSAYMKIQDLEAAPYEIFH